MARIHRSAVIQAPAHRIFAYLENPVDHVEWLPGLMEIGDIEGVGEGQRYSWRYKMAGVPLRGETIAVEHVHNQRLVLVSIGGSESTWTFCLDEDTRGTTLDLTIVYTIPIPVLGKLAERLVLNRNEREIDLAIENIRERMEH